MSDSFHNVLKTQCEFATRDYKKSYGYFSIKNFKVVNAEEEDHHINAVKLCSKLQAHPCITVLSLVDCDLGDSGFQYLCVQGLSQNKTLKELNISRNRLGPECAIYLSILISSNSTIQKIFANTNRFCGIWILRGAIKGSLNTDGIVGLLQSIRDSHTLISVDLHSNAIGGFPGKF